MTRPARKNFAVILALCGLLLSCKNTTDSSDGEGDKIKKSDWLFLCYFDGDDSYINDDLYRNIRDIECAFAQTRNEDGSPREGFASVTALVLWDGISEEKKLEQEAIHPEGALYEIGADYSLRYVPENINEYGAGYVKLEDGFSVGPNTKDLTSQAGKWLKKEPDMSDPATFTNFLKWAKKHYSAPNVVVCLQDHGAGTYKETYTDSTASSRTLCVDASTGNERMLTCKNITDALTAAGYTGEDKPKILWNDVCSQATAEIVWNYKGCADYYCASPNVSWMPDYYGVFSNIKSGMTAVEVGKVLVSAYFQRYYRNLQECPANEEEAINSRASGCSLFTNSFMSLDSAKINALYEAVEKLSGDFLKIKESNPDLFNSIYTNYIKQDVLSLENCMGLAYSSYVSWHNDLGWFCKDVVHDGNLAAAHDSALALLNLLKHGDDNLIIYAWGGRYANGEDFSTNPATWTQVTEKQSYLTGQKDFISQKEVEVLDENDLYGLVITGSEWGIISEQYSLISNYDDWTGFSSKWGQVINSWREFSKQ